MGEKVTEERLALKVGKAVNNFERMRDMLQRVATLSALDGEDFIHEAGQVASLSRALLAELEKENKP